MTEPWTCSTCHQPFRPESDWNPASGAAHEPSAMLGWFRCDHLPGCSYAAALLRELRETTTPTMKEEPSK